MVCGEKRPYGERVVCERILNHNGYHQAITAAGKLVRWFIGSKGITQ